MDTSLHWPLACVHSLYNSSYSMQDPYGVGAHTHHTAGLNTEKTSKFFVLAFDYRTCWHPWQAGLAPSSLSLSLSFHASLYALFDFRSSLCFRCSFGVLYSFPCTFLELFLIPNGLLINVSFWYVCCSTYIYICYVVLHGHLNLLRGYRVRWKNLKSLFSIDR